MPISTCFKGRIKVCLSLLWLLSATHANAQQPMVELIQQIKPSVVGVGLFNPLAAPKTTLMATGFAIAKGQYIATNAHAVPELDPSTKQQIAILLPGKTKSKVIAAELVTIDKMHDLAILKMLNGQLPPVTLSKQTVYEGTDIAFTGFPIGTVLGLNPVTHRGMVSSVAPAMLPIANAGRLTTAQLRALRNPYNAYQLDATAYPGNSGSPVYDVENGQVIAIINKVLLTSNKESALTDPSGITYAIPVQYLEELMKKANIK